MLRMRNLALFVFYFCFTVLMAQTTTEISEAPNKKVFELGFTGLSYRGYDFSKDFPGVRDRYDLSGTPGIVLILGEYETQLRMSAMYSEVAFNTELRGGAFGFLFNQYNDSRAHYYRQSGELRIGFIRTFYSAKKNAKVLACYSGDLYYGYGRHKYAVFYDDIGGFGEEIGYRYNSAGLTQNFGIKFLLKANFTLYAETGFAFEGMFAKKNYYDASLPYFRTNTTLVANLRLLQISLTKKI